MSKKGRLGFALFVTLQLMIVARWAADDPEIGVEHGISRHVRNGEEFTLPLSKLLKYGDRLFIASFTIQEGAGRPFSKGTGAVISDPSDPLIFPSNFNRFSGPDAGSCAGCHSQPYVGGGGDRATSVFVLAQRFDFATLDHKSTPAKQSE